MEFGGRTIILNANILDNAANFKQKLIKTNPVVALSTETMCQLKQTLQCIGYLGFVLFCCEHVKY